MKRLLKVSTIACGAILGFLVIIWPGSYSLNLAKGLGTGKLAPSDSIRIIFDYRLGFEKGAIWIYNYEMPWFGGTTGLSDGPESPKPVVRYWYLGDYGWGYEKHYNKQNKLVEMDSGCDFPGIYMRRFWTQGQDSVYSTLKVSLIYPILLSAVLPSLWILRQSRLGQESVLLPIIKAPLVIQLYRCLFVVVILYFGSYLVNFQRGGLLSGFMIIASFPFCALLGLVLTCIRVCWSRWVLAAIGILIPGVAFGILFIWLSPFQGWLDILGGLFIWCGSMSIPATCAWALFKDKKTSEYFKNWQPHITKSAA